MKVGLDAFTICELKLDPFEQLDFVKDHDFEGIMLGNISGLSVDLDKEQLRNIRQYADKHNLYSHVSIQNCNPWLQKKPIEELRSELTNQIRAAAAIGWHELRSTLGGVEDRYSESVSWEKQMGDSIDFIRSLQPVLLEAGSRINLETHGDVTTYELVRLVEKVGPRTVGICLDMSNVLLHAEDPVMAAQRAAPYTHLTHSKDGILFFSKNGFTRQGRPPGQGVLDWEKILPILAYFHSELPLTVEDHKFLFEVNIYDKHWHSHHPDLTPYELGQVLKYVWRNQQMIDRGELQQVDQYESIPFLEQMEERLAYARDYLKGMVKKLGLSS